MSITGDTHYDPVDPQQAVQDIPEDVGPVKEPKVIRPSVGPCEAPSGLAGSIRRLKLREMNILGNRKLAQKGTSLSELLKSVWMETEDLGLYKPPFVEFKPDSKGQPVIRWDQVFIGDRTHILLAIRELTRGPEFSFEVPCSNQGCRRTIPWTVDLRKLERHGFSDEVIHKLTTDGENLFYRTLPYSGIKVAFRILTGADEAKVARIASDGGGEATATNSILLRLPYIEGTQSPVERADAVEDMDLEDIEWLQEQWEAADIYVQQELEVECPHCWKVQRVAIPFDADFFLGRSSRTSKKSGS